MSAKISISEASRRWGISRQTIYNKFNSGEISVSGKGKSRKIDITELIRVFGDVNVDSQKTVQKDSVLQSNNDIKDEFIAHLKEVNHQLLRQIDLLNERLAKREELDQKLLEHKSRNGPIFGGWFKNKK